MNLGCVAYKEGKYEEAIQCFQHALEEAGGFDPHLCYNVALCYYKMHQLEPALKLIRSIITHGIKEHPDLSIGLATEGMDVYSVGNTLLLQQTALVEAFNLKAAIEYKRKDCK